jgi:hypothetical protein
MRNWLIGFAILSISISASCDVQSGITKKSVEKYVTTPTPAISPTPTEEPIDPADIVQTNTTEVGPMISVNTREDKMNVVCNKYNRVTVNGSPKVVTIKGICSQITLNGHGHDVTVEVVTEVVFNGSENKVHYSKYANAKRPAVTNNSRGENLTEKVTAPAVK